jgi:serine/threonine protein kinase
MIERRIRNFQIKELIATGGMAAIYKAVQISLDRIVAVKILHAHLTQDKDFIIRFEREAKAAANLQHENIVNIIDFGQEDEIYFIAMEYVDGKSLKDLLSEVKFLPQEIALGITLEVAKGLGYAHQKGIVHRDVKPANILIGYDGLVKIADFGLAQAQDLTSVTVTGSIVGTPAYMSPEQASGKRVDNRSDIFSLGVVLYEMLTGMKPFKGENYSSVIHEILTATPPKPFEANPLILKELSPIVERMLEKDPEKRYQRIEELSEDIQIQVRRLRMEVERKDIGEFVSNPEQVLNNLSAKRKERHFERGLYFMNAGYDKIDEAIDEFERVLILDPSDTKAKEYINELKKRKEKGEKKLKEKKAGAKRSSLWIPGALILLGLILFSIFKLLPENKTPKELNGFLVINSIPDGAMVFINGDSTGKLTPATIGSLKPGEYKLELKKEAYESYTQKVSISNGETIRLDVTLSKIVAQKDTQQIPKFERPKKVETPVQGPAYLRVKVEPWARIYIDGNYIETTPIARSIELAPGVHNVRLENPNFKIWQKNLKFNPGQTLNLNVRLEPLEGSLKLIVKPWADVYIDGKFIETTPIAQPIKLPAGKHTLKLINPMCKIYEEVIEIKPNQMLKRSIELEKK